MKSLTVFAVLGALSLVACGSNGASSQIPATNSQSQARSALLLGGVPAVGLSKDVTPTPEPTPSPATRSAQFLGGVPSFVVGSVIKPVTATPTPAPAATPAP